MREITVQVMNEDIHTIEIKENTTYGEVLSRLDINPEAAVAIVDGTPQPEKKTVDTEEIKIMKTISGG